MVGFVKREDESGCVCSFSFFLRTIVLRSSFSLARLPHFSCLPHLSRGTVLDADASAGSFAFPREAGKF